MTSSTIEKCNTSKMTQSKATTMNKNNISSDDLKQLLVLGGDERLFVDSLTGVNMYGCTPGPRRPSTSIHISSSTATPISTSAFAHLTEAMTTLNKTEDSNDLDEKMEILRQQLLDYFGIQSTDADIVFVPSGTDATLQSVFLSKICLPRSTTVLTSLILAVDEAAGRVLNAASGFHFNSENNRGEAVSKGSPIAGLHGLDSDKTIRCIELSYIKCQDEAFVEELTDRLVNHDGDSHVLLHAIDCSKLGNRTPTHDCLDRIEQQHSKEVLTILIDACQFRLSPKRIRDHINRGRLVTITGSKFLTGPPFSGAIVVPARFRNQIQRAPVNNYMSSELAAYTVVSDWPQSWTNIRCSLGAYSVKSWRSNIGPFLRWTAAVFELRRYLAVPSEWREQFIVEAGAEIQAAFSSVPDLIEPLENRKRSFFFDEHDEEFRHPTIFPFIIRQSSENKSFLNNEACKELYRKLQIPTDAYPFECLIGQPALVVLSKYPEPVTTFRFSIDARTVADEFQRRNGIKPMTTDVFRSKVRLVIKKIGDIVHHQQAADMSSDRL